MTPRVRKNLDTTMNSGRFLNVAYASQEEFQFIYGFTTFVVNLNSKECGCRFWKITRLPCKHVCACISLNRIKPKMFCDDSHFMAKLRIIYVEMIHPMPDINPNNRDDYHDIEPSSLRRQLGRPRQARKKSVVEGAIRKSTKKKVQHLKVL